MVEADKRKVFPEVLSGVGQIAVAVAGVACWSQVARVGAVWFWIGAALWAVAVALKFTCAGTVGAATLVFLQQRMSPARFVMTGAVYTGVQSSIFEMGITLLAALIWPSLGEGAGRAIAVGVGAGAIEAFMLGLAGLISLLSPREKKGEAPVPDAAPVEVEDIPLFWLLGTVERTIALLCHASTRALLLLGMTHGDYGMVFGGVLLFTLLDGAAGAIQYSGVMGRVSMWLIELGLSTFAFLSIPILVWCHEKYGP